MIRNLIGLIAFFILGKLLDLIRVFAHAKRRFARENKFLEKVGLSFMRKWFRVLWKVGRWVFRVDTKGDS